jgi:hypothetical protein
VPFIAPSSGLPHAGPSLLAVRCDSGLRGPQDLPLDCPDSSLYILTHFPFRSNLHTRIVLQYMKAHCGVHVALSLDHAKCNRSLFRPREQEMAVLKDLEGRSATNRAGKIFPYNT